MTDALAPAEELALRHLDRTREHRTPTARTAGGETVPDAVAATLIRRGLAKHNPMVGPRAAETFVSITPAGRRTLLPPPLEATLADGSQVTLILAPCHFCGGHDDYASIGMRAVCPSCRGRGVELGRYLIRPVENDALPEKDPTDG